MELWQLRQRQSLPLEAKVELSKLKIREWYEKHDGEVYVSFSGGKDSTVLLNLVRSLYPDVPAVFVDTGLEYPEIRDFVKSVNNVIWLKPKATFKQIIAEKGYPVISKKTAKALRRLQNPSEKNAASRKLALEGIKRDGTKSKLFKLAECHKYLIDAPFKISEQCCDYMKKEPINKFNKKVNKKSFVGTMASDGQQRESTYLENGCNNFSDKGSSQPLGFWTEQDVLEYISLFKIPYAKCYGRIVLESYDKGKAYRYCTGVKRTGCMFCMFGIKMEKEPNRFQRMQISHPQLYNYCMKDCSEGGLGLAKVLDFINVPYKDYVPQLKDYEQVCL